MFKSLRAPLNQTWKRVQLVTSLEMSVKSFTVGHYLRTIWFGALPGQHLDLGLVVVHQLCLCIIAEGNLFRPRFLFLILSIAYVQSMVCLTMALKIGDLVETHSTIV